MSTFFRKHKGYIINTNNTVSYLGDFRLSFELHLCRDWLDNISFHNGCLIAYNEKDQILHVTVSYLFVDRNPSGQTSTQRNSRVIRDDSIVAVLAVFGLNLEGSV